MSRLGVTALLATVLLGISPNASGAQDPSIPPTREEFVAKADRICEVPYRKALRLIFVADRLADEGSYGRAGAKLVRASRHVLGVNRELSSLTPPPADARLIGVWLDGIRASYEKVRKAGKALKANRPGRGERLLARAKRGSARANEKVSGLGFDHCA